MTKKPTASNDSETETEEHIIPTKESTRLLSVSTPEKDFSSPKRSDLFNPPSKIRSDSERTGTNKDEEDSDSDQSVKKDL